MKVDIKKARGQSIAMPIHITGRITERGDMSLPRCPRCRAEIRKGDLVCSECRQQLDFTSKEQKRVCKWCFKPIHHGLFCDSCRRKIVR